VIKGIGTDIVEVKRIKSAVENSKEKFLSKVFTDSELAYSFKKNSPYMHLAARFAAKEAVFKAFGCSIKGANWKNIEIRNDKNGKPSVILNGTFGKLMLKRNIRQVIVSLSHTGNYATATAILIGKQNLQNENSQRI